MANDKPVTGPTAPAQIAPVPMQGGIIQVQRIANPNRPVIYANNSLVVGTQWDIQMYFSLVHEIAPMQFGAVEEVMVVMTPEHALAFVKALRTNLDKYEEAQGKVREIKVIQPPAAQVAPAGMVAPEVIPEKK
jgi:hypothetical protein